jgi:hypothetical protein
LYCLHAAQRLGYLTEAEHDDVIKELRTVAAPLFGLMKRAERALASPPSP